MSFFFKFGATQNKNPLRKLGLAGPHLLTVNPPCVAIENCCGANSRQIGACTRLAKSLAPIFVATQNGRQEPGLLFGRTKGDQSRPKQTFTKEAGSLGTISQGVLLGENQLFGDGGFSSSKGLGPCQTQPASATELLLPGHPHVPIVCTHFRRGTKMAIVAHEGAVQPLAYFMAKLARLGRLRKVHDLVSPERSLSVKSGLEV